MGQKLHVRRDDLVEVIAGDYKGTRGRVLKAMPREGKVVVEGVNMVWKHVRRSMRNPRGGRTEQEAPIDASNVMLLCQNRDCPRYDKPVRVRVGRNPDGTKSRLCVKCGKAIVAAQ